MSDEVNAPSTEGAPETTPVIEAPTDFREYNRWRDTGELPAKEPGTQPAAAPETGVAENEPQQAAEDQQQQEEDDQQPERPGRGGSRVRKIERLERELELAKAQLAVLQPKQPQPETAPKLKAPEPPGKPKLQDFTTLEEYQEALTDWKLDQREAAKAAQSAETAQQTAWATSEKAARTAHADYDDVVSGVKAPEGPGVAAARQAMLEDEAGAAVLYHLATHPDELARIAAMQPLHAVLAVSKLAAKLSSPVAATTKPAVSAALPKPPPSLSHPAKTTTQNINDENFARNDYPAWEKAHLGRDSPQPPFPAAQAPAIGRHREKT